MWYSIYGEGEIMTSYLAPDELLQLNERDRRLTVARYAIEYGRGGIAEMHRRYKISKVTITKGIRELRDNDELEEGRVRKSGGGRKSKNEAYPELDELIISLAGGDPSNRTKSYRKIVRELKETYGITVSYMTVSRTLEKYKNRQ